MDPESVPVLAVDHQSDAVLSGRRSTAGRVLLRVRNLRKRFGGHTVLDGIDIELRQGEVVLLRGENGAGKTTLLNILTGNMEPDAGEISYLSNGRPRTYGFPRRWWEKLNPFDHFTPEFVAREGVGRTWQDIRLFHAHSLRDNIAVSVPDQPGENPIHAVCSPALVRRREIQVGEEADAILERFGLGERAGSSADRVSLGQSKRVAIGRALASRARIIFLDEPFAGLDRQGIRDVLGILASLVREHAITLVIVEHVFNLAYLREIATVDWLLARGKLVRSVYEEANESSHPVELQAVSGSPAALERLIVPGSAVKFESLPGGASLMRVSDPMSPATDEDAVLAVRGLTVQRGTRSLRWEEQGHEPGLTLTLRRGEVAFLQAPNGWGKTTLMDCVAGLVPVASGEIRLEGRSLAALKPWDRARAGVRLVKADRNVFVSLSGNEMLRLAGSTIPAEAAAIPLSRQVATYSGGQRQQLALSLARASQVPKVFLFDEPFSMLDSAAIERFATLFRPDPRYAVLVSLPLLV